MEGGRSTGRRICMHLQGQGTRQPHDTPLHTSYSCQLLMPRWKAPGTCTSRYTPQLSQHAVPGLQPHRASPPCRVVKGCTPGCWVLASSAKKRRVMPPLGRSRATTSRFRQSCGRWWLREAAMRAGIGCGRVVGRIRGCVVGRWHAGCCQVHGGQTAGGRALRRPPLHPAPLPRAGRLPGTAIPTDPRLTPLLRLQAGRGRTGPSRIATSHACS